jgi:hypothetical protein
MTLSSLTNVEPLRGVAVTMKCEQEEAAPLSCIGSQVHNQHSGGIR